MPTIEIVFLSAIVILLIDIRFRVKDLGPKKKGGAKAEFGFARNGQWVSLHDYKIIRIIFLKWAEKNDLSDADIDVLAKFLGINSMPWEDKLAGLDPDEQSMSLKEVIKLDHPSGQP